MARGGAGSLLRYQPGCRLVFVPTLVSSYHIPPKAHKARPVFYALALASFAGAVALFVRVVDLAGLLEHVYPTYWI